MTGRPPRASCFPSRMGTLQGEDLTRAPPGPVSAGPQHSAPAPQEWPDEGVTGSGAGAARGLWGSGRPPPALSQDTGWFPHRTPHEPSPPRAAGPRLESSG